MGQAQINVRTRACSRTSIARTRQAALTHNVRGKELRHTSIFNGLMFAHQRETLMLELEEEQMLRESAEQELQKLSMESDKIRGQHRALQEEYRK